MEQTELEAAPSRLELSRLAWEQENVQLGAELRPLLETSVVLLQRVQALMSNTGFTESFECDLPVRDGPNTHRACTTPEIYLGASDGTHMFATLSAREWLEKPMYPRKRWLPKVKYVPTGKVEEFHVTLWTRKTQEGGEDDPNQCVDSFLGVGSYLQDEQPYNVLDLDDGGIGRVYRGRYPSFYLNNVTQTKMGQALTRIEEVTRNSNSSS